MPFQKGNPGGPGRPPKIVEDAKQSVLLRLFDEKAEEAVVRAQINEAKSGSTVAATWLWERKFGKIKEALDHTGDITITVRYAHDRD